MTAPESDTPPSPTGMNPAEVASKLRELFPALFGGPAKPIKLRIQADIQERAPGVFTKTALSGFLRRYTGSTGYLIALTKASQRIDLDGQPAGEVSDEHREAAATELARRRALHESRRQAEEAERRERWNLLRAFETTTLTKENFCRLKGIEPDSLEAILAQAREEAAQRAQQQKQWQDQREPRRPPPDRREGRRDDRGEGRRDGERPGQRRGGAARPPGSAR